MELLQIIESSVFLFSLFGIFLLLISFASYRMKRTNNNLILQTIQRSTQPAAQPALKSIASVENVRFVESNSFPTNRFIILNENPIVTNNARKENHSFEYLNIDIQSEEYKRLRPAKFYSLEELK
ncbi:MAG: hypothetical protein IPJ03_05720 [Ignavibacteriales bacterium]|nr:hypothetical protein [Ignavibacteriales bacterium]